MPYPGSDFTTISGKIKAFTSGPTTERLLILGTAVDGPINVPINISDITAAEQIFGPAVYSGDYKNPVTNSADLTNNGATIPRAISQAFAGGCTDIWVCRTTGNLASAYAATFGSATLHLRSVNPGRIYNDVSLTTQATGGQLRVTLSQPPSKGGEFTTYFSSALLVGDVIDRINGDRRNVCLEIVRDTYATYLVSACTVLGSASNQSYTVGLSGGTNGTNAVGEDYATSVTGMAALLTATDSGTFDTLKGQKFRFNIAVLTGIYIDDQVVNGTGATTTTIATDYVLWLDAMSTEVGPCFGIIACRPTGFRNQQSIIDHVNNNLLSTTSGWANQTLKWTKAGYFLYTGWNRVDPVAGNIDLGQRLAVCAGPDVAYSYGDLGVYSDNFHVSYASLLTTIPPERAPIFKPIPGITAFGVPYPAKYANKLVEGVGFDPTNQLSGKGAYVCLTRNPRDPEGPLVIFDDSTAAARDDYMRNYQLVHLCNNIHNNLDFALGGFLGGPTSPATLAAMETVVQNILDGYVQSNALRGRRGVGYDFKITMTGTDQALGIVRVFLELAPATALRKIYFVVAVRQTF